ERCERCVRNRRDGGAYDAERAADGSSGASRENRQRGLHPAVTGADDHAALATPGGGASADGYVDFVAPLARRHELRRRGSCEEGENNGDCEDPATAEPRLHGSTASNGCASSWNLLHSFKLLILRGFGGLRQNPA